MLRRKPPGVNKDPVAFHGQATILVSGSETGGNKTGALLCFGRNFRYAHLISEAERSPLRALSQSGLGNLTIEELAYILKDLGFTLRQCVRIAQEETLEDLTQICTGERERLGTAEETPRSTTLACLKDLSEQLREKFPEHRQILDELHRQLSPPPSSEEPNPAPLDYCI